MTAFFIILGALALITFLFLQQASFGKTPSGERKALIFKSTNYRAGIFENVEETKLMADDTSYVSMMKEYFSTGINRNPTHPLPFIKTDLKSLPDKPLIIWFGHSSYLICIDGKNILVDPVLSRRASPVQYAGMKAYKGADVFTADDFPPLDAIIITHDHYDHLDYLSITKLKGKTKHFYAPLGVGAHLEHWGVHSACVHELDWWQSISILSEMKLTATPARHFSGRLFSRNKTLWCSYVLQSKNYKLFIGGDSGYDQSFKKIGDQYGPFDLVILEAGQYDVKWPQIHMQPEEAVQASIDLKGKILLPVHWGKFTLALHPWNEPVERIWKESQKRNVTITTPMIGEAIALNGHYPSTPWWRS